MIRRDSLLTLLVALAIVVVFFSVLSLGGLANSLFPICEHQYQHHIAFATICDSVVGR
jgi:hypothetical protein